MRNVYSAIDELINEGAIELPNDLASWIHGGFKKVRDEYYFIDMAPSESDRGYEFYEDKTGYECAVNAVHIDDYTKKMSLKETSAVGLLFARRLLETLAGTFETEQFNVIYSTALGSPDCSVRFHKYRKGELWLSTDLDAYQDGVLVISNFNAS